MNINYSTLTRASIIRCYKTKNQSVFICVIEVTYSYIPTLILWYNNIVRLINEETQNCSTDSLFLRRGWSVIYGVHRVTEVRSRNLENSESREWTITLCYCGRSGPLFLSNIAYRVTSFVVCYLQWRKVKRIQLQKYGLGQNSRILGLQCIYIVYHTDSKISH